MYPRLTRNLESSFKLAAIKLITPGKAHLEAHYADLKDKPFFAGLVECMSALHDTFSQRSNH